MHDRFKGKGQKGRTVLSHRRWYSHWGLSALLALAILLVSLVALLTLPERPMRFLMRAPMAESATVPISEAIAPSTDSQDDRLRVFRTLNSPPTDLESPIISAHEPATAFDGERDHLAPDIRRIVERGRLNVAIPGNDAFPFFYGLSGSSEVNGEGLEGLDIEIGRSLAAYLGVDVVFDRSSPTFDAVIDQVFEGKADLAIAKISLTLDRARKVRYSQPYVRLRPGLLFNRLALSNMINVDLHQNPVDVVRQLGSEALLGVIRASSYASFARSAFPQATIIEYPDWDSLVDAIIHGRVLAGCRDELAIKYAILMGANANVQMQSVVIDEWIDEIAVALPWESTVLSEFVDHYLSKTQLSFTADQLLTQFISTRQNRLRHYEPI